MSKTIRETSPRNFTFSKQLHWNPMLAIGLRPRILQFFQMVGKMTLMAGYVLVLGLTYQFLPGGENLHLLLVGAPLICQLNHLVVVHTPN